MFFFKKKYKINLDLPKHIFREYDIRGKYIDDINEDTAYTIGLSFGSYVLKNDMKKCIIGHDNRLSSPSLHKALLKGLLQTGIEVVDLGLVTTPMYYYGSILKDIPAGIMVTASHNPKDDNGFKIAMEHGGNLKGKEVENFYNFTIKGKFLKGKGKVSTFSIEKPYIDLFDSSLNIDKDNNFKVVIDPGNGTSSIIAKKIYSRYITKLEVINDVSDGNFPNHHPDPTTSSNLKQLRDRVLKTNADLGIAFDGDGDRLGIVDNLGNIIPIEKYMVIIIKEIFNNSLNKKYLYDVKCSNIIRDEILKLGGEPYEYRTGNSFTRSRVNELDLAFGGEYSGHVYFRDRFPGFDSGLYAGLRLIEIMINKNSTIEELLIGTKEYFNTEVIKEYCPEDLKNSQVEKVRRYAYENKLKVSNIDGVKILYEDGWALVRKSNTTEILTLRFEAETQERLDEIKAEIIKILSVF